MALTAGAKLGPYEVLSPLGAGGMGEVYRAKDTRLGREVAVKVLPAEFSRDPVRKQRFEREAKSVSALNHPHICTLYDIGSTPATAVAGPGQTSAAAAEGATVDYLVMEYLEGDTLAARNGWAAAIARAARRYLGEE